MCEQVVVVLYSRFYTYPSGSLRTPLQEGNVCYIGFEILSLRCYHNLRETRSGDNFCVRKI